jgi:siderophore synthetase component
VVHCGQSSPGRNKVKLSLEIEYYHLFPHYQSSHPITLKCELNQEVEPNDVHGSCITSVHGNESRVTGAKLATHIAQLRDSIVANMVYWLSAVIVLVIV